MIAGLPAQSGAQRPASWWPSSGAVMLGGGHIEPATFDLVAARLIALAGGPNSTIAIIPTANAAVAR